MSETLARPEAPSDAELISAVRDGDVESYGALFSRHVDAARRLARQLASPGDADDLVSDAFAKVLGVLQRGGGPDLAFRAYLLTALRRLHVDRIRASARLHSTDDLEPFDPGVPFRDTAVEGFESAAAARAFASLPERWQVVLWHTEIEGQKPADVAVILGMSANSVSALAYRAREGLRQAFLTMHAGDLDEDTCRWTLEHLGSYVRKGVSRRDATRIEEHLQGCRRCLAVHLELTEVNSNLAALIGPVVLGSVAAAYLGAAAGGFAVPGLLLMLLDRAKDFVIAHAQATAVAGVAATTVVAGTTAVALPDADRDERADRPPSAVVPDERPPGSRPGAPGSDRRAGDSDRRARLDERRDRRQRARLDGARPEETSTAPSPTESAGTTPTDAPSTPTDTSPTGPDGSPATSPDTSPGTSPASPSPESPSLSGSPAPGAPSGSGSPPAGTPSDGTPTGSPTPTQPDVSLSATARPMLGGLAYDVAVRVSGLRAGRGAELVVRADGLPIALTLAPQCRLVVLRESSCRVRGATTLHFTARQLPTTAATLTFVVRPEGGRDDPRDNSAQIVLRD
ncbi:sigma-70 family RNA polymerase sigma factor [Nocardioides pacificus]